MALKTTIGKADYDRLTDELKKEYIPDGDGYKLDADYEDVAGLKNKTAELLAEIKKQKALIEKYGDLDPEVARAALEKAQAADDEKLKAAGEYETLKKKLEERHADELAKATAREQSLLSNLKRERLQNYLVEKGVLPERSPYALVDIGEQIELVSDDSGFSLRLKGGIGDAKELETAVEGLKTKSPFLFSADGASGSGASGSGNGGGGPSTAKTWTRAEWDKASTALRSEFSSAGGQISG